MKNTKQIMFVVSGLFLAVPALASAATQIYFQAPSVPVSAGTVFPVRILLDADQIANAYAVTVAWSGPVQFVNSNNANSIITILAKKSDGWQRHC